MTKNACNNSLYIQSQVHWLRIAQGSMAQLRETFAVSVLEGSLLSASGPYRLDSRQAGHVQAYDNLHTPNGCPTCGGLSCYSLYIDQHAICTKIYSHTSRQTIWERCHQAPGCFVVVVVTFPLRLRHTRAHLVFGTFESNFAFHTLESAFTFFAGVPRNLSRRNTNCHTCISSFAECVAFAPLQFFVVGCLWQPTFQFLPICMSV